MKYLFSFLIVTLFCAKGMAQQVGSKVSLLAADGKTYTGIIKETQADKYKVKYDGFDFEAWLTKDQFTVTEETPTQNNEIPALPAATNPADTQVPATDPQPQPQPELTTIPATDQPPQNMGEGAPKTATRNDSLKMAINNIKNAFGAFSKLLSPKRDTLTIMISEIDYDNQNLALLKEDIKKIKGVRSVTMHYKSSTAIMEISGKGKATDIWDNLPARTKSAFKMLEAGDNNIIVKQKYIP